MAMRDNGFSITRSWKLIGSKIVYIGDQHEKSMSPPHLSFHKRRLEIFGMYQGAKDKSSNTQMMNTRWMQGDNLLACIV